MENKPVLYICHQSFRSQKVLMNFYEKGIDFEIQVLDSENGENYSSSYLRLNPRGELPTLEIDDKFISGYDEIIDYVEEKGFGRKTLLSNAKDFKLDSIKTKILDISIEQLIFGTAYFPQYRTHDVPPLNSETFRSRMIDYINTRSERLRLIAKKNSGTPAEAILLAKAIESTGNKKRYFDPDEHQKILTQVLTVLEEIENHLSNSFSKKEEKSSPIMYLDGQQLTGIDCLLAIVLHQVEWLGYNDYITKEKPSLSRWWNMMKNRESFHKSTKNSIINISVLKRKIVENKFQIITVLGLFAAFALGYFYRTHTNETQKMTRFIILEKLW